MSGSGREGRSLSQPAGDGGVGAAPRRSGDGGSAAAGRPGGDGPPGGAAARRGFTTSILHSDRRRPIEHGALHKPLHTSVAYGYADARQLAAVFQGSVAGFAYGRQGNPTTQALEDKVTAMEDGVASVCFATGMAAIGAVMLALLRAGDRVVSSSYLFGNTNSLFGTLALHGVETTFVDATRAQEVERAIDERTRLVFVETIANPRTQVADLARIGELCRQRGLIYVVDNTMTSPYLFRPIAVEASLVINALTKYIGGHGNALGGSVTDTGRFDWSRFPNILDAYKGPRRELWAITQVRKKGLRDWGAALAAEQAHHLAVGAETLALRMERCCANALALARLLEGHPRVARVYYPGLASHPQHELAGRLFGAYGGLLAFELVEGIDCFDFLDRLEIAVSSSNLGDTRTLVIPVAHTIYYEMGAARRASMDIADSLIRVSVGIEDIDDLLGDFASALDGLG